MRLTKPSKTDAIVASVISRFGAAFRIRTEDLLIAKAVWGHDIEQEKMVVGAGNGRAESCEFVIAGFGVFHEKSLALFVLGSLSSND